MVGAEPTLSRENVSASQEGYESKALMKGPIIYLPLSRL